MLAPTPFRVLQVVTNWRRTPVCTASRSQTTLENNIPFPNEIVLIRAVTAAFGIEVVGSALETHHLCTNTVPRRAKFARKNLPPTIPHNTTYRTKRITKAKKLILLPKMNYKYGNFDCNLYVLRASIELNFTSAAGSF